MEMLRGMPVTTYCEKKGLPLREKIALFREVCGGVQHAHQKGVIHRDLKPSNVLVVEVDGRPVPKIIDFGIAKALDAGGMAGVTCMTQGHFILGTPQYMSPEQTTDVGAVDTRSDIYALGTLLYELLTGTPPFDPRTLRQKGPKFFRRMIREEQPRRPSTSFATQHGAKPEDAMRPDASRLPPDLDWITLRALEKEPQRRYQSAAEFAADLQRFLHDEPVSAHPPSTAYLASRWIKRHRVAFAAACVSVLALLTGTGVALWQARRAHEAQLRAEAESERSRETADFLNGLLGEVAEEVRNGRNPEALRLALISSQKRIREISQDPELQIALMQQVAGLFDLMSDRKLSIEALRQWAELAAAHHGPDSPPARAAAFRHLIMMVDHGTRIEAVPLLEELKARIEQHEGRGSKEWFHTQGLLVRVWTKLRRGPDAARVSAESVAEARRQKLRGEQLHVILMTHAGALEAAHEFDAAEQQIAECIKLAEADGSFAAHEQEFGNRSVELQTHRGQPGRAADLQKAIVARFKAQPDRQQDLPHQIIILAEIENLARRHAEAVAHASEALELIHNHNAASFDGTSHAGALHEDMLKALEAKAEAHRSLKQTKEAVATASEALHIAEQGGNQTLRSRALLALALAHEAAGHLDEAWRLHHERYELHAAYNATHKNRLEDLQAMIQVRLRQQRPAEALEQARDGWRQILLEPSSSQEPEYVADWAQIALNAWKACHQADPAMKPPEELAAWETAVSR
jgi:tetratricopeptide (TPR) repeat protein